MKNRHPMYEFRFKRAYIENKSFLIYKSIREKFRESLPSFYVTTYSGKKRTGTFFLIFGEEKIPVYCDEQGHVRQSDRVSLYRWFEKNQPKEGDILQWYLTDNTKEFLIELIRSEEYVPKPPMEIVNEGTESQSIKEHGTLKDINKFFELKEKGILTNEEYENCKNRLLSQIEVGLDNIESLHNLSSRGVISEEDFRNKKDDLIKTFDGGDASAE